MTVNRFEVYLINLDPSLGSEIKKTRPCVIISPDEMNHSPLNTVIIAPLTSTIKKHYPTRITCTVSGRKGQIVLDQLRAIDNSRIIKKIATINHSTATKVLNLLQLMFRW